MEAGYYLQVKKSQETERQFELVFCTKRNEGTKFGTIDNCDGSISIAFYENPGEPLKLVSVKECDPNGSLNFLDLSVGKLDIDVSPSFSLVETCPLAARFRCFPQNPAESSDDESGAYFSLVSL